MEALTVELLKVNETNTKSEVVGAQMSKYPELFCDNKGEPYIRNDKTGVVKFIKRHYPAAFLNSNPLIGAPIIIDSMQDIVIKPTIKERTFGNYVELFISTKIVPYFRNSNQVVVVFDAPIDNSPKYMIRKHRDQNVSNQSESLSFDESTPIPPGIVWKDFLANRNNKIQLIKLIVEILRRSFSMLKQKSGTFYCN